MSGLRFLSMRRVATAVLLAAALSTLWFGLRSYRSFRLLQSAYALGAPEVSRVRGWMTLRYVAETYHAPVERLLARLGLPPTVDRNLALRTLADGARVSPFVFVQQVQRAIVEVVPARAAAVGNAEPATWFGFGEQVLSGLLIYGYPVLGLTLLLGAVGAPVPTGFATVLAGSLAAKGHMSWLLAGMIAVVASIIGDIIGYGIGRKLGDGFLQRHGGWLGLTPERRLRVEKLFARWGGVTVLLTRTLVSHLSSVVSVLAGLGRYRMAGFLAFAALGRLLWASAYLGLGYAIGGNLEAATDFLQNLSGLLISLAVAVTSALAALRRDANPQ